MNKCLISHHCCLGDLIASSGIATQLINFGYEVHWPVVPESFKLLKNYIKLDNLIWYNEEEKNFPMIEHYHKMHMVEMDNGDIFIPMMRLADSIGGPFWMANRWFWARDNLGIEFSDWRKFVNIERNYEREQKLIDTYNLKGDYIIVNNGFAYTCLVDIDVKSSMPIHIMNHESDISNGFHLFDWIGALEGAREVHTPDTSTAYLADKYCINNKIYMYERKTIGGAPTYHASNALVMKNPNWILK